MFYDSFGFVIKIFVIEVDISSSDVRLLETSINLTPNPRKTRCTPAETYFGCLD